MLERRFPAPPRLLTGVAAAVVITGVVMAFSGAVSTGMSSDEANHVKRLASFEKSGIYATPKELKTVGNGNIPTKAYAYGPVTTRFMHGVNRAIGIEGPTEIARTPAAYMVRHLVVAATSLLALGAVGVIAGIVLGSWQWGAVGAGVLAAIPMWTGHAMFNPKDISVAAGHTLVTLSLVLLATVEPSARRRFFVLTGAILTFGTVLMLGTRPGMWVSMAGSLLVLFGVLAWARSLHRRVFLAVAAALAVSYGVLFLAYPRGFSHPVDLLWNSAVVSSNFDHRADHASRAYFVEHTLQEWPLILLVLMVVGSIAAVFLSIGALRRRSVAASHWLLIGTQAFGMVALVVLAKSPLYNGLRQLLFAVPAQALLATIGLAVLLRLSRGRRLRMALASLSAVGLILPSLVQLSMFPYQYAYLNVAAELGGAHQDMDYWETGLRALLPYVSEDVKVVCPHFRRDFRRTSPDCRTRQGGTFSPYYQASGRPAFDSPKDLEFQALVRGSYPLPVRCTLLHQVTRRQNVHRIVISQVALCQPKQRTREAAYQRVVNPWDPAWPGRERS